MCKRQKQSNPSSIKWPTEGDVPLNKTQTLCLDSYWAKQMVGGGWSYQSARHIKS